MLNLHALDDLYPHSNNYAHGVGIPAGARWVFTNGQAGVERDGTTPATIEEQAEIVFNRIAAILAAENMTLADVVRLTAYLVHESDGDGYRSVRNRRLGDHKPAATLVFVKALHRPDWRVEVEAVAAKVD